MENQSQNPASDEFSQYLEEQERIDRAYQIISDGDDAHNAEFSKLWPDHCKKCGGWGLHSYTEMHGFNHGSGEDFADPCECVESGKCARCGKPGLVEDDGEGPCSFCGWNYDDGLRT